MIRQLATAILLLGMSTSASAQAADQHHGGVVERGNHVMGFSHEKTTHHFRLLKDGGSIEAIANDVSDTASKQEIRDHFEHIAVMFSHGDFNAPILIHERTPPGVPTMKKLRSAIRYRVEDLPSGARIGISSENPKAVSAIHEFLRFQIEDHQTGDPTTVSTD